MTDQDHPAVPHEGVTAPQDDETPSPEPQESAAESQGEDVVASGPDPVEFDGGGIVCCLGGDIIAVPEDLQALTLQEGTGQQEGATEWTYSSTMDFPEVDPVAVALGFTTEDGVHALYSLVASSTAQVQSAAALHPELRDLLYGTIAASDVSEEARALVDDSAFRVLAARRDLDPAVEALYEGLSKTEETRVMLNKWRRCMARKGYDYESPEEVETALVERRWTIDSIPALLEARDQCLVEVDYAADSDRAVLEVIPDWKSEYSVLLSEYREALDQYEKSLLASE
jgi:hypothetical protein